MARNIEIKAKIPGMSRLRTLVESIADVGPEIIDQEDTFYNCPNGRLKLRDFLDDTGVLIYYQRDDSTGPTKSEYLLSQTDNPKALKAVLEGALGKKAVIRKCRTLYKIGQTRVHLDEVENLGSFVELEVVLGDDQTSDEGITIAKELMGKLEIKKDCLENVAYVDLLLSNHKDE